MANVVKGVQLVPSIELHPLLVLGQVQTLFIVLEKITLQLSIEMKSNHINRNSQKQSGVM